MKTYLFIICLFLVAYEGVALINRPAGDTISEVVWYLSRRPIVPFLFGLLCGHFFWQRLD